MSTKNQNCLNKIGPDTPANTSLIEQKLKLYMEALKSISILDPETDSEHGWNEWGEADCFNQAQEIARKALGED